MQYILLFLEGVITFISPCMLPMLPIYASYFAGKQGKTGALINSVGFVLGFTAIFVVLGAVFGSAGTVLAYITLEASSPINIVNIVTGFIVVVFGLNFLGILKIPFLNRTMTPSLKSLVVAFKRQPLERGCDGKTDDNFNSCRNMQVGENVKELGFMSSVLFGLVFSISWTPCIGAFLGAALMKASQQGSAMQGMLMLLAFSMGLGIPFVVSAVLIDRLKTTFDFIKKHYHVINAVSGIFLVIIGILMMTGVFGYFLSLLTF